MFKQHRHMVNKPMRTTYPNTNRFQLKKRHGYVDMYGASNHEALGCAALKSSAATALLSFNLWRNTQKQDIELLTKQRSTNAEQEGATGRDMGGEKNLKEAHGPTPVQIQWQNAERHSQDLRASDDTCTSQHRHQQPQEPGGQRLADRNVGNSKAHPSWSLLVFQDPPCLEDTLEKADFNLPAKVLLPSQCLQTLQGLNSFRLGSLSALLQWYRIKKEDIHWYMIYYVLCLYIVDS